jgi:hypothetical protein
VLTTSAFAAQLSKMTKIKTIQKPKGSKAQNAKDVSTGQNTQSTIQRREGPSDNIIPN